VKNAWLGFLLVLLLSGCDTFNGEVDFYPGVLSDTLDLAVGECAEALGTLGICLDSITEDSRCPEGVVCVWEGNAGIQISVTGSDTLSHEMVLNTHSNFLNDTMFEEVYIALMEVAPYPSVNDALKQEDYLVRILVEKMSEEAE
jgi:hypothetical protein